MQWILHYHGIYSTKPCPHCQPKARLLTYLHCLVFPDSVQTSFSIVCKNKFLNSICIIHKIRSIHKFSHESQIQPQLCELHCSHATPTALQNLLGAVGGDKNNPNHRVTTCLYRNGELFPHPRHDHSGTPVCPEITSKALYRSLISDYATNWQRRGCRWHQRDDK